MKLTKFKCAAKDCDYEFETAKEYIMNIFCKECKKEDQNELSLLP